MIKSKYLLSQEVCCTAPGNFIVHEMMEEEGKNEQESGFSEMNFAPQDNVGKFQENGTYALCCFSCKAVRELTLQMYGQRLSQATTQSNCCLNLCRGELVVYALNKVIIGKIKKTCSAWCSPNVLVVENDSGKDVFFLNSRCCQPANLLPRILRCSHHLHYEVLDPQGKLVATIANASKSCLSTLLSLRDDFHVHFIDVQKQKDKILLLNAVVFLNQLRHEWL